MFPVSTEIKAFYLAGGLLSLKFSFSMETHHWCLCKIVNPSSLSSLPRICQLAGAGL